MRISFLPVEKDTWPSDKVWDAAQSAGIAGELRRRFTEHLLTGNKPTLHSFERMAAHLMSGEMKRNAQPRTAVWFPRGGTRELIRLIRKITEAPWDASEYRASAYSLLIDYGYEKLIPKLYSGLSEDAITSVHEWAQIGRGFLACKRYDVAGRLLGAWRNRTGVAMWMVTNYILSLSRLQRDELQERFCSARDALAGLPHDSCAKYLVHMQAEACALLGDRAGLSDIFSSYKKYFNGRLEKDEYFAGRDFHLLHDMQILARYLSNRQEWPIRRVIWKLQLYRFWSGFRV
jgi:hypothetical protein